ncbi:MAG: hypothetical protein IJU58_02700 [Clostridia bacterium]|nr:hypothetical protein [Clostridia bacterium]
MYSLAIERKESKKGNDYFSLVVDLGYRKQVLTYDKAIIIALCNIREADLYELVQKDVPYTIGDINLK